MHNAQPLCLLRRPELFTWAETLFSQYWGGATLQFIKQQRVGRGDSRDGGCMVPCNSYRMLSYFHTILKTVSSINMRSTFSVRSDLKLWSLEGMHLRNNQPVLIQFQSKICASTPLKSLKGLGAHQLWKENQAAALSHKLAGKQRWERGRAGEFVMVSEVRTPPRYHRLFLATVPSNSKFVLQDT